MAELVVRGPFQLAAWYTSWREWQLTEEEWKRLKDPATNLVQDHLPSGVAGRVAAGSDVLELAQGVFDIVLDRRMRYRAFKADIEGKADAWESASRNGVTAYPVPGPGSLDLIYPTAPR